ncbi:restriction endonuclease subunit S [Sphingobacterium sp. CZ-2]|uniref:restriction endonuclease subunit S n=1 Tax=Sphingobacterium sp. CZ-2 TaxID=2557994 RepID=UPI0014313831|nr:restriction endonuclease subunit S [Sphingobacterium sp. CZ-2]
MNIYEAYKDSGIDWLGEIPSHWEVKPGFTVLKERKEKNKGMISSNVLSLSYGKIIEKPVEKLTGLVPENFETYQLVYEGDIIFRPTDLQNDKVSLRTGLSGFKGIITSAYINLQPINNSVSKFIHYYLHTTDTNKVIYGLGSGLRQNISFLDFKRFAFALPPLHEQEAIAQFLDEKCAKIDDLVAIKNQQIEKLKELRQVKIHQAVTKGLDTSVELKDSGIDWIGEIPKHWEVTNFKRILIGIKDGTHGTHQRVSNGNLLLSAKNIHNNGIRISGDESMIPDKDFIEITKNGYPKKNDLLITCVGTIGRTYVYDLDYPIAFQRSVAFLRFNSIKGIPNYFKFYIESPYYQFILSQLTKTSAQGGVYMGDILKSTIILPPLSEQEEIVSYLERETFKIDQAIAQRQEQIEMLKAYKQSLINEVVTGKLKVA